MFVLCGAIVILLVQKKSPRLFGGLVYKIGPVSGLLSSSVPHGKKMFACLGFASGANHVRNRKDDHDGGFSKCRGRAFAKLQGRSVKQRSGPQDGIVRVWRERRRASVVSVVTGLDEREIVAIAGDLKKRCGTGGTAKNGKVEIQGDHRDAIVAFFLAKNRPAKKAGG